MVPEKLKVIITQWHVHSAIAFNTIIIKLYQHTQMMHTLLSSWTFATLRAASCNCAKSNSSSSLGFWASWSFSCHTKQERRETSSSTLIFSKVPLYINSLKVNSSALLIEQTTLPLDSRTSSSLLMYLHNSQPHKNLSCNWPIRAKSYRTKEFWGKKPWENT